MKYADAKKLHNKDEVFCKDTNSCLHVIQIDIDAPHRDVYVLCDNGEWYHHRTLK